MSKKKSSVEYGVTITPYRNFFDFHLGETWKYRDLIFLFVKRDFVSKFKQTILGPLWVVVAPLLSTIMSTFIFNVVAQLDMCDVVDSQLTMDRAALLFFMAGNVCWTFFLSCFNSGCNALSGNSNIMGKVYFPRLVSPISSIFSNLINFGIQFVIFLVIWGYFMIRGGTGMALSWHAALLPLLVLEMSLLGLGCGMIVSSFTIKYRDLNNIVGYGMSFWQYYTPVVYGLVQVSTKPFFANHLWLYMINPMASVVLTFRYAFFGEGYFNLTYYLIGWAITLFIAFLGLIRFSKVEKNFLDTI